MIFTSALAFLASATILASAAPVEKWYGCDVSDALLDLPSTNVLNIPSGTKPVYITLGVGTQNYTCTSAGNYTSAGAVAKLIDISCLYEYDEEAFDDIQDHVYNLIPMYSHQLPSWHKIEAMLKHYPKIIGDHYFTKQNDAIAPVFDFRARSKKGDENAFTIDKRVGGIPSPDGKKNIDWLQLESTAGQLAKYTFRVDTKGGVAPKSCHNEGHTIKVPYVAKYWFYN
ncbi:malate dehydrogenase [Ceratobasidium sp. AG-Ba]|nr:malate dehydrogenase [Ceratobasidium sp. AG-Ba]